MADKDESAAQRRETSPAWVPLSVVVVITIVYLAFFASIVIARAPCSADYAPLWFETMLHMEQSRLACRPLNSLGDFLAGVFAPLAFLYLGLAVWLQSRELHETREVMIEQAKETKATREQIATQTELQLADQRRREKEEADETFDEIVQTLAFIERTRPLNFRFMGLANAQLFRFSISEMGADLAINEMLTDLPKITATLSGPDPDQRQLISFDSEGLRSIIACLQRLVLIEHDLSPPHAERAERIRAAEAIAALRDLHEQATLKLQDQRQDRDEVQSGP